MISQFYDFKSNYMSLESWKKWYVSLLTIDSNRANRGKSSSSSSRKQSQGGGEGESNNEETWSGADSDDELAIEVLKYRKALTDFGESAVTRAPRPSSVHFRVGQVVKHKQLDLKGVIIGWDDRAQAPNSWLHRNYVVEEVRKKTDLSLTIFGFYLDLCLFLCKGSRSIHRTATLSHSCRRELPRKVF